MRDASGCDLAGADLRLARNSGNGYRLRSYTELLWARVLEAAEIFYLYEPDLVRVDDGYYLPDFWLPNVGVYLEVKGKNPTDIEIQKADAVMARTGREVMFLVGRPESDREGLMNCGMLVRGSGGWASPRVLLNPCRT